MSTPREIGARFRRARMFLGWKQERLAEEMRKRFGKGSKDTVARIEKGLRQARPNEITMIEELTGRPLDTFVPLFQDSVGQSSRRIVEVTVDALVDTLAQIEALRHTVGEMLAAGERTVAFIDLAERSAAEEAAEDLDAYLSEELPEADAQPPPRARGQRGNPRPNGQPKRA